MCSLSYTAGYWISEILAVKQGVFTCSTFIKYVGVKEKMLLRKFCKKYPISTVLQRRKMNRLV